MLKGLNVLLYVHNKLIPSNFNMSLQVQSNHKIPFYCTSFCNSTNIEVTNDTINTNTSHSIRLTTMNRHKMADP